MSFNLMFVSAAVSDVVVGQRGRRRIELYRLAARLTELSDGLTRRLDNPNGGEGFFRSLLTSESATLDD